MPLSTPSPISYPHKFTTPPSQNTTPMPTPTPPPTPARISLRFLPTVIWKKDKTKKCSGSWCSAQGAPCAGTPTGRGFCLSSPRPSHLLTPGCKNREGEEPAQDPGGQRLRIWRSPGQHHSTWPPASLLVTSEDFLWGRSCGVGMWSPVTRFLSGPALGSCLFFILALAML